MHNDRRHDAPSSDFATPEDPDGTSQSARRACHTLLFDAWSTV